jgi:hypothetical protein
MPLILGANTLSAGGYEVDNSLRFNSGSSDYLSKTFGSASNRQIFTISFWVKRAKHFINSRFSLNGENSGNNDLEFILNLKRQNEYFSWSSSSLQFQLVPTQVFRDVSAWYHMVLSVDTTQATASNRVKIYINGSQVTALDTASYPAQNANLEYNTTRPLWIGRSYGGLI